MSNFPAMLALALVTAFREMVNFFLFFTPNTRVVTSENFKYDIAFKKPSIVLAGKSHDKLYICGPIDLEFRQAWVCCFLLKWY